MISIKDFLNKIIWDSREKPEEYIVVYFDRIEKKNIEVKFNDLMLSGDFLIVDEASIPLHRVREVRKKGKVVWKRL